MGNDHSSWGLLARPIAGDRGGQRSAGAGQYLRKFNIGHVISVPRRAQENEVELQHDLEKWML